MGRLNPISEEDWREAVVDALSPPLESHLDLAFVQGALDRVLLEFRDYCRSRTRIRPAAPSDQRRYDETKAGQLEKAAEIIVHEFVRASGPAGRLEQELGVVIEQPTILHLETVKRVAEFLRQVSKELLQPPSPLELRFRDIFKVSAKDRLVRMLAWEWCSIAGMSMEETPIGSPESPSGFLRFLVAATHPIAGDPYPKGISPQTLTRAALALREHCKAWGPGTLNLMIQNLPKNTSK